MFFSSIITYKFLPTDQLLANYNRCLPSLLAFTYSYTLHLRSYRNHVKKILGNYKFPAREGLAVLKKIVIFWKFWNGSINLLGITIKKIMLKKKILNNAAKTCLYGPKISENIEIEHISQSKAFFHFSGNLHTSCFMAFKVQSKPSCPWNCKFCNQFLMFCDSS